MRVPKFKPYKVKEVTQKITRAANIRKPPRPTTRIPKGKKASTSIRKVTGFKKIKETKFSNIEKLFKGSPKALNVKKAFKG